MAQKRASKGRGTMSRRIARMEAERRRAARRRQIKRIAQIGIPVFVIVIGAVIFLLARGGDGGSATAATDVTRDTIPATTTTTLPPVVPTVTSCSEVKSTITDTAGAQKPQFATPPVMSINPALTYTATIETSKGTIVAQLTPTIAPTTVNSFVFLARCGFYDGTIIHRVAKEIEQLPSQPPDDGKPTETVTITRITIEET